MSSFGSSLHETILDTRVCETHPRCCWMKGRGLLPVRGGMPVVVVLPEDRPGTDVCKAFAMESSLASKLSKEQPNCWMSLRMLSMASCVSAALALRVSISLAKSGFVGFSSTGGSSSSSAGGSKFWVDAFRLDALRAFGAEGLVVGFEAARAEGFVALEDFRRGAMWRPDRMTRDQMSVFWLMDGRR